MAKPLAPYVTPVADDDSFVRTTHVSLRTERRKAALKNRASRATLHEQLLDMGVVEERGCRCSHCARGYDCCGRLVPSVVRVVPVRGGIRVEQLFVRNI